MRDDSLLGQAMDTARHAASEHVALVRDEILRPWSEGRPDPAAEAGRRIGLVLSVGAILVGLGLALVTALGRD